MPDTYINEDGFTITKTREGHRLRVECRSDSFITVYTCDEGPAYDALRDLYSVIHNLLALQAVEVFLVRRFDLFFESVARHDEATPGRAGQLVNVLQPTDLFFELMAAARAGEYQKFGIVV